MCACSVQWWWTSSVRMCTRAHARLASFALHKLSRSQREKRREREERKKMREEEEEGRYTSMYIVTPVAVKWSIFIVRTSVKEWTNGRSSQGKREGRDKDGGSTNVHLYTFVSDPQESNEQTREGEEEEEERERIARWSTHCVRFVLLVRGCMF